MEKEEEGPQTVTASVGKVWETLDGMIDGFLALLPNLVIGLIVVVIFYFIAKGARNVVRRVTPGDENSNIARILGRLTQWALITVGILVALAIVAPSVKPADLLALLGVGGVAFGFAFKDILQNFLAGILLLLRQPFSIGDQIIFKDFEGTVEEIETRATLLKTYDGKRVLIPNGELYTNAVVVNTAFPVIRSEYDVGIGYGDDLHLAMSAMKDAMAQVEEVAKDPAPEVLVWELAGSTVNLRARWWSAPKRADVVHVRSQVIAKIKERMDAEAIDLPYPTQVVLWHDQTEATDGDRTAQREGWPAGTSPPKPRNWAKTLGTGHSGENL